jgi:hypothetical protein
MAYRPESLASDTINHSYGSAIYFEIQFSIWKEKSARARLNRDLRWDTLREGPSVVSMGATRMRCRVSGLLVQQHSHTSSEKNILKHLTHEVAKIQTDQRRFRKQFLRN